MVQKNWEDDSMSTGDEITAAEWVDMANTIEANSTHVSGDGSDHTYIDQDVTSGSSPSFSNSNFTNDADYLVGNNTAEITVSSTAPSSPSSGDLWVDTSSS